MTFLTLLHTRSGPPPPPPPHAIDGSGLIITRPRRRHTPARAKDRLPEDIRREQLEDERYLAELEKRKAPPSATVAAEAPLAIPVAPLVPQLPDALARAASAMEAIERARASSAEARARLRAEQRRRTALLLLALD